MTNKCSVYIISSTSGHCKIGIAKNPNNRLKQLQTTQGPYRYSLAYYWYCGSRGEARFVESELHRLYRSERVRGEWFELTPEHLIGIGHSFEDIRERYAR